MNILNLFKYKMYFKKLKLFQSDTLDKYQMLKVLEILETSVILWQNVFLSWKTWTWKTQILQLIRNVSDIESQIFDQKLKEFFDKRMEAFKNFVWWAEWWGWEWLRRDQLDDLFRWWRQAWRWEQRANEQQNWEDPYRRNWEWLVQAYQSWNIDAVIQELQKEAAAETSDYMSTFHEEELQNEIFNQVDANQKELYVHFRTTFLNFLFSFVDLSLIAENFGSNVASALNEILLANIQLSKKMKYKNQLVFLIDNLNIYSSKTNVWWNLDSINNVIKTFDDEWVISIIAWSESEYSKYKDLFKHNINKVEIILDNIEQQISNEIINTHVWLEKNAWLKNTIKEQWNTFSTKISDLRKKYKKNEPAFTNEIISWLFDDYKKQIVINIKNSLNTLNVSDINLMDNHWINFDIYTSMYKKYADSKKYTAEEMKKDIKAIKKIIIWQDTAIEWTINSIFLWKWFNKNPIASLMFLWPTWVWKSELARQIAKYVFNDESKIKIIPMNEYQDAYKSATLIWAPAWYVWHEESKNTNLKAIMTEMKEWVILFDEIEKAHSSLFDFLMTITWDWTLAMADWLKDESSVSFKNFVVIFTTNEITSYDEIISKETSIWFTTIEEDNKNIDLNSWEVKEKVIEKLKDKFRPEFLWRIDNFYLFNALSEENLTTIIKNYIEKRKNELKEQIKLWDSPFTEKDIDAFLFFDNDEIESIVVSSNKTKLWARYAIKKCEEVIMNKMNFHFTWEKPAWKQFQVIDDDNDNKEEDNEKAKRKERREKRKNKQLSESN